MSKRYPGNFITGNPVALSQTSNAGVWDLKDNYQATTNGTWQEGDGIYEIGKSLRFRKSATAYISKTPTITSNQTTFTYSCWVKQSLLGSNATNWLLTGNTGSISTNYVQLSFSTNGFSYNSDEVQFTYVSGNSTVFSLTSNALHRDPSGWYHVVFVADTTNAISTDRVRIYINGNRISSFKSGLTYPSQNTAISFINSSSYEMRVGGIVTYGTFDGYMTEANFIDGQALDPSYFGYTDSITGIWQPKPYTGSYGTNGFYLPFNENNSLYNLGRNRAGSNYLLYSSDFTNAQWTLQRTTGSANVALAPDGTTTAYKLMETATTGFHYTYESISLTSGVTYTMSCYAKAAERTIFYFDVSQGQAGVWFDLSTGNVLTQSSGYTGSMKFVGNGWYRCSVTVTANATGTWYFQPGTANADNSWSFAGTAGSGLYIWGPSYNLGATPDNYIATTSAAANNDWTPNNFSLTAGVTYDSMVDSPTNVFTSATDIGGVVPGNYCTWNPLYARTVAAGAANTLSNGNLTATDAGSASYNGANVATMGVSSGKWYWECTNTAATAYTPINGIGFYSHIPLEYTGVRYIPYRSVISSVLNTTETVLQSGLSANAANGDVIGIALDADNKTITFYKNNTIVGATQSYSAYIPSDSNLVFPGQMTINQNSGQSAANFGQRPFAYTPPTGFKSLNTTNIQALGTAAVGSAAIQPNKWFDINLYGGYGTDQNIVNSGFQPDLVWIKNRSSGSNYHILTDSARGPRAELYTNATNNEASRVTDGLQSFNSNGFTINNSNADYNATNNNYVAWQWKQSPIAGFNIVSYTGDGSNNRSITHNLGVAPKMMMIKGRDDGGGSGWIYWHSAFPTKAEYVNSPTSFQTNNYAAYGINEPASSGTVPTASSFYVSASGRSFNSNISNGNGYKYIAYLWTEVPGFSKFGSYVGNGSSDGVFIYCGFRPKYLLIKRDTTEVFVQSDTARTTYNSANSGWYLIPSTTAADANNSIVYDFLSNGFKFRNNSQNESGSTYTYVAFAESPFALNNRAR